MGSMETTRAAAGSDGAPSRQFRYTVNYNIFHVITAWWVVADYKTILPSKHYVIV